MSSRLVLNDSVRRTSFSTVLRQLLRDATALDLAVSYIQASGWDAIERLTTAIDPTKIRLLVTDQFGISHPDTLRKAKLSGAQVRAFVGGRLYHPKVYIVYDSVGRPSGAIVGSANLSGAALELSVEAGCLLISEESLTDVVNWFEQLFQDRDDTTDLDEAVLRRFDRAWRSGASSRVRISRTRRKSLPKSARAAALAEDVEVLEDLFYTIKLPIGILSIDQAGNNIRNLTRLLEVIRRYPAIGPKERSELHLLGFLSDNRLTRIGNAAKKCKNEKDLAELWCEWVLREREEKLQSLNARIASFRRAATQFWNLHSDVREFFLANLQSRPRRNTLKVIELLCSGSDLVRDLELSDFESLAPVVSQAEQLPQFLRRPVLDYWDNKGSRSWSSNDRSILLTAWRKVSARNRSRAR